MEIHVETKDGTTHFVEGKFSFDVLDNGTLLVKEKGYGVAAFSSGNWIAVVTDFNDLIKQEK